MAEIKVTVSLDANSIKGKVDSLLDDATLEKIHQSLANVINPWTPYLSGNLSKDVAVSSDGVVYNAPYASDKYYGYAYHKEEHPLATSHWLEVAMEQGALEPFEQQVKDILIQRAKELYG